MNKTITFKHMANLGDLIAALAGIRKICIEEDCKAIIYQQIDVPASYYEGADHPTKDASANMVMMNKRMFDMVKPLTESQFYVSAFELYEGQDVMYDLDIIRGAVHVNMPYGLIQRWISYWYPELQADLCHQWVMNTHHLCPENLQLEYPLGSTIVLNFTSRYRNPRISYYCLRQFGKKLLFLGTPEEYQTFKDKWGLTEMRYAQLTDFSEAMYILANCKQFIGNQSFLYNLAEAMKVPRLLELCTYAPNCFVMGVNGNEYMHQHALEFYLQTLL